MRKVHEGLGILLKYIKEGATAGFCAEHDQIYAHCPESGEGMSEEDRTRLDALGWHWNEFDDCWIKWV
ncbi:hypothetical protein KJ909_03975 [Patescibacteria group bacterium]|nr:hypothetical protein [Patescibacteria group bacterium]